LLCGSDWRFTAWQSFPANHAGQIVALDSFVVPTNTFRLLYAFLVLSRDRRRVLHFGVTAHPTSAWTAQQLTEAFPFESPPRFVLRDRDGIYGDAFRERVVRSLRYNRASTLSTSPTKRGSDPFLARALSAARLSDRAQIPSLARS
jgi:hypothetical protein